MSRKKPNIDASATADIAFLLLIFFLVSTTMNVDSGLQRTLPPIADNEQDDKGIDMNQRNMLLVNINFKNQLGVNGTLVDISQLKDKAKEFFLNPQNDQDMAEREVPTEPIPFLAGFKVSKGVISLQSDRGTSYESYIKVQNELTRAINEMRNELSLDRFGKKYSDLSDDYAKSVNKAIPTRISEAEPRNVGR